MFTYCDTISALKCQDCFSTFIVLFIRWKSVHIYVIMHVCIYSCCSSIRHPFTKIVLPGSCRAICTFFCFHSETQFSGRLGMSGGGSPRHAQNPLSGERRKTLSITHHALSPPPSHHHLYIIHLIN